MMKVAVFDVAAESRGALTILHQYYEKAKEDAEKSWLFVISIPNLIDTENVKVLKYPWVKKSWLHRIYFEIFISGRIVKEYNVDEVISLHNICIQNLKVKQTLYLHQSLPFIEKRYKISENIRLWIYQNIIGRMISKSVEKADKVIVQTKWIKEACLNRVKTDPGKFILEHPKIQIEIKKYYESINGECKLFFYPASGAEYKNHRIIIAASKKLMEQGIKNFKVIFTLKGDESRNISKLYQIVEEENLPVDFIGHISLEEVLDYYSKSILIFPSYVETFGLPLLEARMHNSPILASDCAFSHEILDKYERRSFFDPFNHIQLYELMKNTVTDDSFI